MKKTASNMLLADFVRELREKKGLTQKQVADQMGYSTAQFISSWERGEREPPVNALWTLAEIFEVSAQRLYDVMLEYRTLNIEEQLKAEFLAQKPKKKSHKA